MGEAGTGRAVPRWYWAVAVIALLWEAAGCFAYLRLGKVASAMPVWAWSAFAIAVWVGLAGAVLLLLRSRWARAAFAVSLAGVAVQLCWTMFVRTPGPGETPGPPALLFVLVAGGVLLWFSDLAAKRGWLR